MITCYLGIGSNLGNREKNIRLALQEVRAMGKTKIVKLSKIIETRPAGGPRGQGNFLNAALKIKTNLAPLSLLKELQHIEKKLGRVKTVRWGPRKIDLDILFYGEKIINRKELKVPHPKVFERDFVIKPLCEVI